MSATATATATATSAISSAATATATAAAASASQFPPSFKIIGVVLAVVSGLFIGASFPIKKKGLIRSLEKSGKEAGEGHAYLKDWVWILGMVLMILGEILNFGAYAFTAAILVTPLGALSVVFAAILSSIFLKETLTLFGKLGCALCIIGAVIIALNGPQESTTTTIREFKALFISPGFLVYASLTVIACIGIVFFVAPKHGSSNMMVYISICSLIGGISVSCTQGLGAAIVTSVRGENQFREWFSFFLLGFVILTLLIEINYLNKALALFNTSMVTPVYFVLFTVSTIVSSTILYQGFKASPVDIVTVVFGFFVICIGITLLQLSKVEPDQLATTAMGGQLDRKSTILLSASRAEVHDSEKGFAIEEPGMDALRGGFGAFGSIHRAISTRKSMHRESGFNVNEIARRRRNTETTNGGEGGMDEMGMQSIVRTQLYDNPMPRDAADKVSLYSNPTSPNPLSSRAGSEMDASHGFAGPRRNRAISFAQGDDKKLHEHQAPGGRSLPDSGDIAGSFPRSPQHYDDPYADDNYNRSLSAHPTTAPISTSMHPTHLSSPSSHDDSDHPFDSQLSPNSKTRFNIPNFSRTSSKEKFHPSGPPDLDRQESQALVSRGSIDDDEDEYNQGRLDRSNTVDSQL